MSWFSINIWARGQWEHQFTGTEEETQTRQTQNNKRVNDSKRKIQTTRGGFYSKRAHFARGKAKHLEILSCAKYVLLFLYVRCFFSEMALAAGGVFLALLLFLSAAVPCSSVYNSGECFFNTKGAGCKCVRTYCFQQCNISTWPVVQSNSIMYMLYLHYIYAIL